MRQTCKTCGMKCGKKLCRMCHLASKMKVTQIHDSILFNFTEFEGRVLKHLSQDFFNKCTHLACDLGLGLHDCPDAWQRGGTTTGRLTAKSVLFAQMYGGSRQSKLKGVTA